MEAREKRAGFAGIVLLGKKMGNEEEGVIMDSMADERFSETG